MADKILNDEVLENVSGGAGPEQLYAEEENMQLVGRVYNTLCPGCGIRLAQIVPPSGKITCPECGKVITVKT